MKNRFFVFTFFTDNLVIINPTNRGKGYGKLLMDACEKLAKQLGFSTAVLSTHDKQEFYRKLGYEICDPVSHYGAGLTANKPGLLTVSLF